MARGRGGECRREQAAAHLVCHLLGPAGAVLGLSWCHVRAFVGATLGPHRSLFGPFLFFHSLTDVFPDLVGHGGCCFLGKDQRQVLSCSSQGPSTYNARRNFKTAISGNVKRGRFLHFGPAGHKANIGKPRQEPAAQNCYRRWGRELQWPDRGLLPPAR